MTASPFTKSTDVRQLGINPNHWYVVALSREVTDKPVGVVLWDAAIVLYRDSQHQIYALEDSCPHRFVKLSRGCVIEDELECAYHGWRINAEGGCAAVPYLAENQKLPSCRIRRYPVREQDGFVWLFPGDPVLAEKVEPMGVPEWDHLNYIGSVTVIDAKAHFSYLIENLMDMYHGHLHQDWQAWTGAVLEDLEETGDRIDAHYQAQNYYRIDKIWSISQLFFPACAVSTRILSMSATFTPTGNHGWATILESMASSAPSASPTPVLTCSTSPPSKHSPNCTSYPFTSAVFSNIG